MPGLSMRPTVLAASLGLAACGPMTAQGGDASAPLERPQRMVHGDEPRRVASVDSLTAACTDGRLVIIAGSSTSSGGWSAPALRRLGLRDGELSFEIVAKGPPGPAVSMMAEAFITRHEEDAAEAISSVRIVAESNEMTAPAEGCATAGGR